MTWEPAFRDETGTSWGVAEKGNGINSREHNSMNHNFFDKCAAHIILLLSGEKGKT
jgi:hypothetical protein